MNIKDIIPAANIYTVKKASMSYTKEQKDKLTPEQLVVAERWEREQEARSLILDSILAEGSVDFVSKLLKTLEIGASHCEHGRSALSTCAACDEIEKLLYGEDDEAV